MAINTLETATLFQKNLDLLAVQEMCTGWMDANARQVIYNGGADIKIPKMSTDALGDYDRDEGYAQGSVTLTYETRRMTQDRGRKFNLDAMDVDETNFIATASAVMGDFQRTSVIPEIDAYRLSKVANAAISHGKGLEYGYTPDDTNIIKKIKDGIKYIRNNGYSGQLVIQATYDVTTAVELAMLGKIRNTDFTQGGVKTQVPAIDNCPIIATPANRMYSGITIYDGKSEGQKLGGYAKATDVYALTSDAKFVAGKEYYTKSGASYSKATVTTGGEVTASTYYEKISSAAKEVNFMIMPANVPIAVTKMDKMRIFTPDDYQRASAWNIDYRRYHDLWVMDNKMNGIYANIKDSE